MVCSGAGGCGAVLVEVGIHGGFVLEGAIFFSDELGLGEILTTNAVDCNGTLGVAEGRGVVVGAIVAPALVVIGCRDLLGEDDAGDQGQEDGE